MLKNWKTMFNDVIHIIHIHLFFSIFTNIQLDVLGIPKVDLGSFQAILRGFLSSYDVPNRCSKETFLWRCRPGHPR